jgi:hypothetical protein
MVEPMSLHTFNLPPHHQDDSGIKIGGAYRVSSDVPIIVQHTRMDTRKPEIALLSTTAYSEDR